MPDNINEKIKEQYDHDNSGGSLNTNLGDFLDSESASGDSINTQWRNWAEGTGTSLNTRLFHKHGGSGSFMTRWKNWIAFSSTHSINFDGSNDYLAGSDLGLPSSNNARSVSFWINADSVTTYGMMFSYGTSSSNSAFAISWDNANAKIIVGKYAGNANSASSSTISTGSWNHIVVTFDGSSTIKYYLNGSADGTATLSGINTVVNEFRIGGYLNGWSGANFFDGKIDEVAVWNVELSATDITSIYNNGKVIDLSKSASYGTDRTGNLKLWLRCGDASEPESTTSIARQDFYTDFDGTDDYVQTADLTFTTALSVSAWVNHSSISGDQTYVADWDYPNNGRSFQFRWNDDTTDKLEFMVTGDGSTQKTNSANFTPDINRWYHLVATYNAGTTKIYINGVSQTVTADASQPTSLHSSSDVVLIGATGDTSTRVNYMNGGISSVSLYQTVLDAQTISQMAKSRFTPMRDNRFSVVDFDGVNDYIDCGTGLGTSLGDSYTGDLSFSIWANLTDVSATNDAIVHIGDFSNNHGVITIVSLSNNIIFRLNGTTWSVTETLTSGWHHIMAVWDSSDYTKTKLYVDGVTTHADNSSSFPSSLNFDGIKTIIGAFYSSSFTYDGSISSVAIYNVAKSAEEVYAIYQKGITYDESSLSGLVGYWRMGDDTSKAFPTIADSSSNSNDGTITNGASDDIVQQMVAGYDLGAFEGSEELGASEITSESNTTFSGVTSNDWTSTGTTKSFSNNQMVFTMDGDSPAVVAQLSAGNFSGGSGIPLKFLKVTLDIDSTTTGSYRINNAGGSCTANVFAKNPLTTGINTVYGLCDGANSYFRIFEADVSTGDKLVLNSFDVQEVLQSEVSDTYPAIIDVNEPVLGVELVEDSDWTEGTGWTDTGDNTWTYTTGTVSNLLAENISGVTIGKTYKAQYTITSNPDNVQLKWVGVNLFDSGVEINSTVGTHIYYGVATTDDFGFRYTGVNTGTIALSNPSLKEIQGNVGTMTNQDSADLVYSSVLPDQSFLTGVNSAYNFIDLDGSNEFISGSISRGDAITEFTLSTWTNIDSFGDYERIFVGDDGQVRAGFKSTGHFTFYPNSTIGDTDSTGSAYSTGQWYHTMVTYNKATTTLKYYRDGALAFTKDDCSSSDIDISGPFWIGSYRGSFLFLDGSVGQTAIWDKDLSSDVGSIYNLGRHGNLLDSYSDNLLGYWAMSALDAKTGLSDVGNGTIYDRSGNSNHGTPTNIESTDLKSSPNAEPNGYAKGDTNRSTTTP